MELSARMKAYETVSDLTLTRRLPCVIRLDGKSFHHWTRTVQASRPFDATLHTVMTETLRALCQTLQGTVLGYTQSDELSLIVQDYFARDTEPPFGKRVQKLVSITASITTAVFNDHARRAWPQAPLAFFDARAFVLGIDEVTNYLIWRQQDAVRNSIRMLGSVYFSHHALEGLSNAAVQEKLWHEHGVNWDDSPIWAKRGSCGLRDPMGAWHLDEAIPIFTQDRTYVDQRIRPDASDTGSISGGAIS